jgi:hypothetical protein
MPVSLPRETLEQILGDEQLKQSTLARCCRLSWSWVDFICPRLYRSVVFRIVDDDGWESSMYGSEDKAYTPRTLALLSTLRNKHIALLVKEAAFQDWGDECSSSNFATTFESFFRTALLACPTLDRINVTNVEGCINNIKKVYEGDIRRAHRISPGLAMPYLTTETWSLLDAAQVHLDTLVIGGPDAGDLDDGWQFLQENTNLPLLQLTTLHLLDHAFEWIDEMEVDVNELLEVLLVNSRNCLRSLALPVFDEHFGDFSVFGALRHLDLGMGCGYTAENLESTLRSLPPTVTSLALRNVDNFRLTSPDPFLTLTPLLPATIRQLRLSHVVPDQLDVFLACLPKSSSLRLLRCERRSSSPRAVSVPPKVVYQAWCYETFDKRCRNLGIEFRFSVLEEE